eukprot:CAMPEP_0119192240 /NCGR_PEP_ID=MMETSP1316-20130426/2805_1 /TAXON_ID=41880 /ORGANISM="Pycnococcus provasolii, Strain RCC2336" /LENGTH=98 /DNA_ID=CAMNT_0007187393 /DNA_START=84 /DNA_END=377 /DNA_ORIENTATION=-
MMSRSLVFCFMVVVLSFMVSFASAAEGAHSRKMLWMGYPGGGGGGGAAAPARLPALSAGNSLTDVGANLLDPMFTLGTYHGRYHHPPDVSNVLDRAKK